MADVVLKQVDKVFEDGFKAVDDFNLEIADKEFIVLVGPSGCGKSTTLRMVAGLEEISAGTVSIDGRVVNDVAPKDRDIAMVFQNYALYPHMTVFDNMAFGLKLRRMPKAEIVKRVHEAAEILSIEELLERRPKQLSGGQRQRVAVGRAIVRKPKVFLFDEPLSNLDAKMRVQMRVEINRLHSQLGATMIYVTHDQTEAMTMGDRIVVMEQGRIQQVADPLNLYDAPANRFVAGFIGMPPMNFIKGHIRQHSGGYHFSAPGGGDLALPEEWKSTVSGLTDQEVTFGIRPEDLGSATAENSPNPPRLRAEVDVLEPMGSETYVYAKVGPETFVSRVDAHRTFKPREAVELAVNIRQGHIFGADGNTVV